MIRRKPLPGRPAKPSQAISKSPVIGAGFTGLNAARKLAKSGVKVALIEAEHVGYGASGRNGGHLNSGHFASFGAAKAHFGEAKARRFWRSYDDSIDMIEAIIAEERIDCSFRRGGKLKLASKPSHVKQLQAMCEELRREVDPSVQWLSRGDVRKELGSETFHGAVLSPKSAMMHMGQYANGMAEAAARHGATIWERNPVESCIRVSDGRRITSPTGSLAARQVILATDAYTPENFDYYRRRMMPIASFIVVTLARDLDERPLHGSKKKVDMLGLANERRAHFERILVCPCRADKDAVVAQCVHHIQRHCPPACRRGTLRPDIDAKEQTGVSDGANPIWLLRDFLQPGSEALAHGKRFLGDLVALQDRQHGVRGRYANRISGERVRVASGGAKLLHRCFATNDRANWKSVAHRLAEGSEIGNDPVPFKAPHMSAGSPKTRLNFVGDDETTCLSHRRNSTGNEARRIDPYAIAGKNTVDEQGRNADATTVQIHNG